MGKFWIEEHRVPSYSMSLSAAATHTIMAVQAMDQWEAREDNDLMDYVAAGNEALRLIELASRLLDDARRQLTGDLHSDAQIRTRQVDAMLAERGGNMCLHGEDSRHRSSFGPPEWVGCKCHNICCSIAEMTAAGLATARSTETASASRPGVAAVKNAARRR